METIGAGGLSGAPLTRRADDVMRMLRGRVGPELTLVGTQPRGDFVWRPGQRLGRGQPHAQVVELADVGVKLK